jgi:hypothetical protein
MFCERIREAGRAKNMGGLAPDRADNLSRPSAMV